ncbi:MAG: hypothetical protein WCB68_24355 [Pyrinomonadaceae bacterium]
MTEARRRGLTQASRRAPTTLVHRRSRLPGAAPDGGHLDEKFEFPARRTQTL